MSSEIIKIKSHSRGKLPSDSDRFSLLYKIERETISALIGLFNGIFNELDDDLLTAASEASNLQQQSRYLGFIEELNQKRNQAQNRFRHYLTQGFRALNKAERQLWKSSMIDLYSIEELELEVSINNIVTKARCAHPRPLLHLMTRLNTLIPQASITASSNPLGPKQIVSSFVIAISPFQLDTATRLLLLKKFEQQILDSFEAILCQANQTLIEAGYLPNINALEIRSFYRDHEPQVVETAIEMAPDSADHGDSEATAICQDTTAQEAEAKQTNSNSVALFNTKKQLENQASSEAPNRTKAKNLPYIKQSQLFKLLDYLQRCQLKTPLTLSPLQAEQLVGSLLKANNAEHEARQLTPRDKKVFGLMDLSFQFIYSQGLPNRMAVLISQLQIPLLKIALSDITFFKNREHPARKLINLIANSDISWESPNNDEIYQAVRKIVSTLANEFYGDPLLLQKLAGTLVKKIETEQQRTERLEQRTIELELGKAKTEQTRQQLKTMLEDRLHGKRLASYVAQFIQQTWQPILLQARLKHGTTSTQANEALKLVDQLLSMCHKRIDGQPINILGTINAFNNYLAKNNLDQQQIKHAVAKLQQTLEEYPDSNDLVEFDALTLAMTSSSDASINATHIDAVALGDLRHQIDGVKANTWFEFDDADKNIPNRCKLVTHLTDTDSLLFTNRFGQRALVIKKDDLAMSLYLNKAKPIIAGHLIDRALKKAANEIRVKQENTGV